MRSGSLKAASNRKWTEQAETRRLGGALNTDLFPGLAAGWVGPWAGRASLPIPGAAWLRGRGREQGQQCQNDGAWAPS